MGTPIYDELVETFGFDPMLESELTHIVESADDGK